LARHKNARSARTHTAGVDNVIYSMLVADYSDRESRQSPERVKPGNDTCGRNVRTRRYCRHYSQLRPLMSGMPSAPVGMRCRIAAFRQQVIQATLL